MSPVDGVGESPLDPVVVGQSVADPERVQVIEGPPAPDFLAVAGELDYLVTHDVVGSARGVGVVFGGVVVVDGALLDAEDDEVAVGQFVDLMVDRQRLDGNGAFGRALRPPGGVPLRDHVAEQVYFDQAEVLGEVHDVPAAELLQIADPRVHAVVPDDLAGGVQS